MPKDPILESRVDSVAKHNFRDVADQDYINARLCYRNVLMHQYSWAALQAIEKLFKGILLFNRVQQTKSELRRLGHDIELGYQKVQAIQDLKFQLPSDCESYIKHLNTIGANRYLTATHYNQEGELFLLDKTVWLTRGYCQNLRLVITRGGANKDLFPSKLKAVKNKEHERCCAYLETKTAYLDRVMLDPEHPNHAGLVWENYYYNPDRPEHVNIPSNSNTKIPAQVNDPSIKAELKKYILL